MLRLIKKTIDVHINVEGIFTWYSIYGLELESRTIINVFSEKDEGVDYYFSVVTKGEIAAYLEGIDKEKDLNPREARRISDNLNYFCREYDKSIDEMLNAEGVLYKAGFEPEPRKAEWIDIDCVPDDVVSNFPPEYIDHSLGKFKLEMGSNEFEVYHPKINITREVLIEVAEAVCKDFASYDNVKVCFSNDPGEEQAKKDYAELLKEREEVIAAGGNKIVFTGQAIKDMLRYRGVEDTEEIEDVEDAYVGDDGFIHTKLADGTEQVISRSGDLKRIK